MGWTFRVVRLMIVCSIWLACVHSNVAVDRLTLTFVQPLHKGFRELKIATFLSIGPDELIQ